MPWRNRQEPPALVQHALAHPPEGFRWLDGLPVPVFAAPFDLLTTADAPLKARLQSWPWFGRWSRWLRVHTAFVGTTVTEYAPLPLSGDALALAAAVKQGPGRSHALVIVKDLPQDSPLLSDADNAFAQQLTDACAAYGFVQVAGQALAYVPIDFATVDEYLARLSASRRSNLRRKLRSRAALRIERVPTGDAFADEARVDAYYALYEGVHAQSEIHFDRLTRDFFAAVLRDGASDGIAFEYRDGTTSALLGWNLCYEYGGRLVDKYIGLAYPAAREANLYFVSWMVNLEYALERGLTHYIAGWTDPEVKRSLGARFTWTRHAVYVRNPLLRALARRFAGHFESDSHWRDHSAGTSA